ncbi:MAG: nuclear transport factor 2 family protein [Acidimicrobiales bacterium]
MGNPNNADDVIAISNLVAESQYLIDSGRWSLLADEVFASELDGVVPEANFGFAVWRGTKGIREGFDASLPRFEACMHAVTNLHITVDGDRGSARYYVQGWHWVRETAPRSSTEADFLVLGVMHDDVVRQSVGWRVARRQLSRLGPGVAVGTLPDFLAGLGES